MDLVDFENDPIDAAIRPGSGHWPGLEAWPLCGCEVRLLALPDLLKRHPIKDLTDLKQRTLIHPRPSHLDWDSVASFARVSRIERKGDLVLESGLAALRAAEQGLVVTLCVLPTVSLPTPSSIWTGWHAVPSHAATNTSLFRLSNPQRERSLAQKCP